MRSAKTSDTDDLIQKENLNMNSFLNPVSPFDAPDPCIVYDSVTEYYYALHTSNNLTIYRSKHLADIMSNGESRVIYEPNGERDGIWGDIWAPELHRGKDGCWYIFTSGRITREPGEKRIFVMKALSDDPFGEWEFKGKPFGSTFSIDPTFYVDSNEKQYICYSKVDVRYGQVLEICEMVTPYSYVIKKAMIAKAELEWELVEPYVGTHTILEGAYFLERNGRLFLIYSANGCWSNYYALGVLEFMGGDMCNANCWKKHPEPLMTFGNGVYGPGHATFFESPDGKEIWCAYHGMKQSNDTVTPAARFLNVQKVDFDESGYPIMGKPVGYETPMIPPSGEKK